MTLSRFDQAARIVGVRSEWLLQDHMKAGINRRKRERHMKPVGCRHDGNVVLLGTVPKLILAAECANAGYFTFSGSASRGIANDHRGEDQIWRRHDQWRVEDTAGESISDQSDAQGFGHAFTMITQ
jgi:hypothetical protein